jgi:UDP-N-acetylglucosamine--N-acetylmuramyl-(pentapeptide) pyrophosphoryl-undecaprenol N-acetylglucosamine transferase
MKQVIRKDKIMRILFACAGTGGHINPAIATARYCMKMDPNTEVLFVGTPQGMERRLVKDAGFQLKTISVRGIKRKLTFENILAIKEMLTGKMEAAKILKEFKPDIILGTGGYICAPVFSAATKLEIPYIIHESNSLPGITSKMFAKKAKAVAVGFEDAKKHFPTGTNLIYTGTPVIEKSFIDLKTDANNNEEKKKPLLLITGGSQGAASINRAVVDMIVKYFDEINFNIIFATGNKNYESICNNILAQSDGSIDAGVARNRGIEINPYIYNIAEIMEKADLAVTRAGAMTCTELTIVGLPAIMIPYPAATENHQEYNARSLEKAGAAIVLLDNELTGDILYEKVSQLFSPGGMVKLAVMRKASLALGEPLGSANLYQLLIEQAKSRV